MEIQFYHLLTTDILHALPKLIEKAYAADYRMVVLCQNAMQLRQLDEHLWSYDPDSFVPHGTASGDQQAQQPILLTESPDNLNQSRLMISLNGQSYDEFPAPIERVIDMFNGADENAVLAARSRWKQYKQGEHTLTYYKQQPNGGWKKEA